VIFFFFNAITYTAKTDYRPESMYIKERIYLNIILTLLTAVTNHSFFWTKSEKATKAQEMTKKNLKTCR